jgi:DNA polymerase I
LTAQRKIREKKRVAKPTETMAEAWERIFQMKLTDRDREKLQAVKSAMDHGEIERDPADMYTKTGTYKKFSKAEALRLYERIKENVREQKIRELVEKTPDSYRLVLDEETLEQIVTKASVEDYIALDTETTGIDVYEDKIVGVCLTLPSHDEHYYIPVAHGEEHPDGYYVAPLDFGDQSEKVAQLPRSFVLEMLRGVLESEDVGKVLHNANFDMHMFLRHGYELKNVIHDTQIAMHVLNENEPSFKLKDLATKYLREPSDTFDELFGKNCRFDTIPLRVALAYAAKDPDITNRLYLFQRKQFDRLPKLKKIYEKVENPLIPVVNHMERTGFILDLERAKEYGKQLTQEIAELERQLREHFGEINLNSPDQLSRAIYDDLKLGRTLPIGVRQKRSTDKNVLKMLKNEHAAIKSLLEYKKKTKLYSTYVDALPKLVKKDGRIHGQFLQASTVTGRFSSRDPNLQNQPKEARPMFVAPEGYAILSADFSQQEPRLLAHFTGEERLIEAYRAGKDLYQIAAAETFGLPLEQCGDGSKYRKMMKIGLLAVMYGTGTKTLAGQLEVSEKEAADFIKSFYKNHPRVKKWVDENVKFCRRYGYVEMLGGRKRRLPNIYADENWKVAGAERQATNARIQGSAAIQTKLVMAELYKLVQRKGWRLLATIHDEILLYVPLAITPEEVIEIEDIMVNTVKLRVPSKTDIEAGTRWGESVKFDRKKRVWYRTMLNDEKKVKIATGRLDLAIKKMYDGISAGWTPDPDE